MANQHHAVAGPDTFASQKTGGASGELAQVRISVLLISPIALDAHGYPGCVAFCRSFKKLEKITIGIDAFWLRAHVLFECRENPLLQTRQMYVEPVVVPVKLLRKPTQKSLFLVSDSSKE